MTYQDKLYYKFYKIYPNSEVKKINKDTSLDIYVPDLHEKRNIHVNFNIKGGGVTVKLHLYLFEKIRNYYTKNLEKNIKIILGFRV
jgi:hypothetical protein